MRRYLVSAVLFGFASGVFLRSFVNFGGVVFTEIPREQNKEADKLANEAMDAQRKNPKFDF